MEGRNSGLKIRIFALITVAIAAVLVFTGCKSDTGKAGGSGSSGTIKGMGYTWRVGTIGFPSQVKVEWEGIVSASGLEAVKGNIINTSSQTVRFDKINYVLSGKEATEEHLLQVSNLFQEIRGGDSLDFTEQIVSINFSDLKDLQKFELKMVNARMAGSSGASDFTTTSRSTFLSTTTKPGSYYWVFGTNSSFAAPWYDANNNKIVEYPEIGIDRIAASFGIVYP